MAVSAPQRYRSGAYGAMVADDNGPWVLWADVAPASAWQSIESAPKDGTWVLLHWRHPEGRDLIATGQWTSTKYGGAAWYWPWAGEPDNWMPLPEPPK